MTRLAIALMAGGLLLALVAAEARAAGFAVAEQGASAAGTGSAGVAREGDPGAAWHNPAALADGAGLRVGLGLMAARPSITAEAMDGSWSTDANRKWSTPPYLSLSLASGDWAAGAWVGVPFGSGVSWPVDWPGRHEIVRSELMVFRFAPFVAWRSGALRVAAGVHVDAGRLQVARRLDFIDVDGDVAIDMDGVGFGVDASVWWLARPGLALGLSYKSRSSLAMEGGADFDAPDAFSVKTADQAAGTTVTLPDRLVLGARWQRGRFAALADAELTLWGVNDTMVIDFESEQTPDVMQVNGWGATLALRGGGEWTASRRLVVRGGLFYDPTPAPDDTLAPSSPDSSRFGVTAGLGWAVSGSLSLDLFAEHLTLMGRDSESAEALDAKYGGSAVLVGLGLRYSR